MRPTVRCRQNAALQIIPRCFAKGLFTAIGRLFGPWAALAEPVAPGDRSEFSRCALVLRRGATCSNRPWAYWTTPFEKPEVAMKIDRKSTRLNSSHANISYAVFCLKKKKNRKY